MFTRCGFKLSEPSDVNDDTDFEHEDDVPLKVVNFSQELSGCDFNDLMEIDEKLQSHDDSDKDLDMLADKLLGTLTAQNCVVDDDDGDDSAINILVSKANAFDYE